LDTAAAAEAPAAGQHNKVSSHRRWSHTKELATSWYASFGEAFIFISIFIFISKYTLPSERLSFSFSLR
jgi:hypothetical protein